MTTDFTARIVNGLRGKGIGSEPTMHHIARALVASGVVADPAEVERAERKASDLFDEALQLKQETHRLRAVVNDIAALHKPFGEGRLLCEADDFYWPCNTADILARHGVATDQAEQVQP